MRTKSPTDKGAESVSENNINMFGGGSGKAYDAELCKALFDAADELRKLRPWDTFCEVDVCEIYPRAETEPYYCSITGMFEDTCELSVYKGHSGLISLSSFINSTDLPDYVSQSRRNCMTCMWGSKNDDDRQDLALTRMAEKKYHGNDEWPHFRLFETGYEPSYLNNLQIKEMTAVINALNDALREMSESGALEKMNEGERIRRRFDEETECWINEVMPPIEKIEAVTDGCVITDELLVRRIKKKPLKGRYLEYDMPYIPVPLENEHGGRRVYPKLCILCDSERPAMENQYFLQEYDDPRDVALGMLVNYMEEKGRPAGVYVRDAELFGIINDLCVKTGVTLSFSPMLKVLDFFVDDIINQFRQ